MPLPKRHKTNGRGKPLPYGYFVILNMKLPSDRKTEYLFLAGILVAALLYGLSLYAYATIWPVLPGMLLLQLVYAASRKKLRADRYLVLAALILMLLPLPLRPRPLRPG